MIFSINQSSLRLFEKKNLLTQMQEGVLTGNKWRIDLELKEIVEIAENHHVAHCLQGSRKVATYVRFIHWCSSFSSLLFHNTILTSPFILFIVFLSTLDITFTSFWLSHQNETTIVIVIYWIKLDESPDKELQEAELTNIRWTMQRNTFLFPLLCTMDYNKSDRTVGQLIGRKISVDQRRCIS